MDAKLDTNTVCECPGHSGPNEHFDACGEPTLIAHDPDSRLCRKCRLGKPLCWDSTCPASPSYPHKWTSVCEEHAGAGC
jgi:hypothetical protein